jgi:hypothetical protein
MNALVHAAHALTTDGYPPVGAEALSFSFLCASVTSVVHK